MPSRSTDLPHASSVEDAQIVRLSDVEPESVSWLWPERIPLGKLTILDGDPGVGKSTLTLDLAARLSRDDSMPDGAYPELEERRGTVLLTAEDGLADTIRPRLDAADADPEKIAALRTVAPNGKSRLPTVHDVEQIEAAVEAVDAALVVVDPLVAYLTADTDSHRDADVRQALAGLQKLAEERDLAVLAIRHLNKSDGNNPIYRGGGSIGIIAAARAGLLVAPDPDAPNGERQVLAVTMSNLADEPPSLAFRVETEDEASRIEWCGETDREAGQLLDRPSEGERRLRRWLLQDLRDLYADADWDAWPSQDIVEDLRDLTDSPWDDIGEKGLTTKKLAELLDDLGPDSNRKWFDGRQRRGYEHDALREAWERYLDPQGDE